MATAFPKVRTDGGKWAILYTADGGGERPIHGAYWAGESDGWLVTQWDVKGARIGSTVRTALDIRTAVDQGIVDAKFKQNEAKEVEGKVQVGTGEYFCFSGDAPEPKV